MKKFSFLLAVMAVCLVGSSAMAEPQEVYNKLVEKDLKWLDEDKATWPNPGLTDAEIQECINIIQDVYKKAGIELTPLQAAVSLGMHSTRTAVKESFRRSIQKAKEKMK